MQKPNLASERRIQLTDFGGVIGSAKNQLGSTIVAGADVRNIRLILHQNLCAAKVTKLEDPCRGIQQEILRFNIPVTDPHRMDVGERTEELVDVDLYFQYRHCSLQLVEEARCSVDSLRDEFEHEVQVYFFLLHKSSGQLHSPSFGFTDFSISPQGRGDTLRLTRSPFE